VVRGPFFFVFVNWFVPSVSRFFLGVCPPFTIFRFCGVLPFFPLPRPMWAVPPSFISFSQPPPRLNSSVRLQALWLFLCCRFSNGSSVSFSTFDVVLRFYARALVFYLEAFVSPPVLVHSQRPAWRSCPPSLEGINQLFFPFSPFPSNPVPCRFVV